MNDLRFMLIMMFAIFVILILTLVWSESQDKKIMQTSDKYEKCVLAEYGVGPANWYEAHGEYPTCPVQ